MFAVLACVALATTDVTPGLAAVLDALPEDADAGIRTELALVGRDLRVVAAWEGRRRATLQLSALGRRYYDGGGHTELLGFDWLLEIERLVSLAAPSGAPVPGALAVFIGPEGVGFQGQLRVEAGFLERLAALAASPEPPPWEVEINGERAALRVGTQHLVAEASSDGWLRIVPVDTAFVVTAPADWIDPTVRRWLDDTDLAIVARGGGPLFGLIAQMAGANLLGGMIASVRTLAIGFKTDGDKTVQTRVLVDIPQFKQFGGLARATALEDALSPYFGPAASAWASVSLPPPLLAAVPGALQSLGTSPPPPPELVDAVSKLDGRVGAVSFGAPGDWALGVGFRDKAAAERAHTALGQWLAQLTTKPGGAGDVVIESGHDGAPGGPSVVHLRSDRFLEGVRFLRRGSTLLAVGQRSRVEAWLAEEEGASPAGDDLRTEPVRSLLAPPAMVSGYMVLGTDGSIIDWLSFSAALTEHALRERQLFLGAPFFERVVDRLPTLLALAGFAMAMTYDVALVVDLDGSLLVLQLAASEI